jgi:hypothetical protein
MRSSTNPKKSLNTCFEDVQVPQKSRKLKPHRSEEVARVVAVDSSTMYLYLLLLFKNCLIVMIVSLLLLLSLHKIAALLFFVYLFVVLILIVSL